MICFCFLNVRSTASETGAVNKEGDARTKARCGRIPRAEDATDNCNRKRQVAKSKQNEERQNLEKKAQKIFLGAEYDTNIVDLISGKGNAVVHAGLGGRPQTMESLVLDQARGASDERDAQR